MPVIHSSHRHTRLAAWLVLLSLVVLGFGVSAEFIISTPPEELTAPCPTLSPGDRFKVRGHSAIYLLNENSRRLYFPHADVYFTWYRNYAGIQEISSSCVDNYPIPDKPPYGVNFRPGTQLVKLKISNSVYVILPNNTLAKVESEELAKKLYGDNWNSLVKDVNDEYWTNFTVGAALTEAKPHNGMTIKKADESQIFYVQNGERRPVFGDIMDLPGSRILIMPEAVFSALPVAASPITARDIAADPIQSKGITEKMNAPTENDTRDTNADTAPPVISNIRVSNITETNATISWTTNEPSSSSLYYSTESDDPAPALVASEGAPENTEHSAKIPYLLAVTTYYFSISAADKSQNIARSAEQNFRTISPPPSGSPVASPGKKKWEFKTIARDTIYLNSSAAINPSGGVVYIGSNSKLYAINTNGTLAWTFNVSDASAPTVAPDGTIYFGSKDNKLYALDSTGKEKWNFPTLHILESPAVGRDGTIYFGDRSPALIAVNPNGTEKWRLTPDDFVNSSPAIALDGTIYFGSRNRKLYAARVDGTIKWTFKTGQEISASPAVGKDGVIYVASFDGKIYAINPDGTEKWRATLTLGSIVQSSPVIGTDGTIYIAAAGRLHALDPVNGSTRWTYGRDAYSTPAIGSDGVIYVPISTGELVALDSLGKVLWTFGISGSGDVTAPAVGHDGTIYFGYGSYVYALGSSSSGLANSPWPKLQKNNQNTAR